MFKHKVIDTIGAISALILGVALSASSALAMRFPDPVGGAGVAQPPAPPLQQTASAPSGTLSPSLIIAVVAVVAVIALVAAVTQAFTHRHSTSHA